MAGGQTLKPARSVYPPLAQIGSMLLNSAFLDLVDQDALTLRRTNELLRHVPESRRQGLRPIDLVVIRPSEDLGQLARACESCLPRGLRFMTRGLGTREAASPGLLSMLMFEPVYLRRLIAIGEADAEARLDEVGALLAGRASAVGRSAGNDVVDGGLRTGESRGVRWQPTEEVL